MATESKPVDNEPTERTKEDTVTPGVDIEPNWEAFDEDGNVKHA